MVRVTLLCFLCCKFVLSLPHPSFYVGMIGMITRGFFLKLGSYARPRRDDVIIHNTRSKAQNKFAVHSVQTVGIGKKFFLTKDTAEEKSHQIVSEQDQTRGMQNSSVKRHGPIYSSILDS